MNVRYLAPSVKKAFDILRIISLSREGIGLNEIARALGIRMSELPRTPERVLRAMGKLR